MSTLNKSLHDDNREEIAGITLNKSFSEGNSKVASRGMQYLAPQESWQSTPKKQVQPPTPFLGFPSDPMGCTSQRSENLLIAPRNDGSPKVYEDDSFLRGKLSVYALNLKRRQTPNLELPHPEKVDEKLNEIGELDKRTPLELLEELRKERPIPYYGLKYCWTAVRYYIQSTCLRLVQHSLFETISLLVIMANCVVLAVDDPTVSEQATWQTDADYVFQALYTLEIVLNVLGMGFVLNEGAYLRDPWNIMDFVIVVFGYLSMFSLGGGFDLKALRTFRVLRPLRTISSVEGLKILISALVTSLPLLMDTIVILMFFFMIFAIAGLQLWHGIMRYRCLDMETGTVNYDKVCGYESCGGTQACVGGLGNPNYGATHFDDVFTALLTVFQCVTMEGWSDTQQHAMRAFGPYAVLFFTPLILIGSFFLVNFTLAVIKSRVTDLYNSSRKEKLLAKQKKVAAVTHELQHEAENKITVAQLLGPKYAAAEERSTAKIFLLAQYGNGKNNSQKRMEPSLRGAYRSLFGFEDLYDEGTPRGERQAENVTTIVPPKKVQPIHEDVIREEEENPLDTSSIQDADNSLAYPKPTSVSRRFAANFKKSLGAPAGIRGTAMKDTTQKIELKNQNKKFSLSGMIGIRRVVPPEVKAAFMNPSTVDGLDEFSDTFFGQDAGAMFHIVPMPPDTTARKDLQRPTPMHSEVSSSLLDFELSRLPSMSKEPTPANVRHSQASDSFENSGTNTNLPPEAQQQFQSWRDIEHRPSPDGPAATRGTALKEQNTMGTAVSSSLSSSINIGPDKVQTMMAKMHPMPRINLPEMMAPKDELLGKQYLTPPGKPEITPLLQPEPPGDKKEEAAPEIKVMDEAEKAKWEANERLLEKYVLKQGELLTSSSSADVLVAKDQSQALMRASTALSIAAVPPYKLKRLYEPTIMPEEEEEESADGVSMKRSSVQNSRHEETMSAAGDSASVAHSMTSGRRTLTARSKGKKKRSKSKKKKKGKKSETDSKGGGSRKPPQSVRDGPSASSAVQSSAKKDHDSKSIAGGSVVSSSKKSAKEAGQKDDEQGEDKGEVVEEEEEGVKVKPREPWSGQEVLPSSDPYFAVFMTTYMSETRVWKHGWEGTMRQTRSITKLIMMSGIIENLMNLLVMVNTVLLAMDRYDQPDSEATALGYVNIIFTSIFTAELVAKLFGFGLVGYLSDPMNYLDGSVVLFSLVEIIFLDGQGALSAFRTLRIFRAVRMIRTLRVLRVARLLRSLRSMQLIIDVVGKTIGSFAYIGLLMMILIFIYALFGMQLFGGKFNFADGSPRQNFDSFNNAFLTMFQVLTMENWQSVLYSAMRAQNSVISAVYLITWIFIGNYILLNLFLAIMLDAFTESDESMGEEESTTEDEEGRPPPSKSNIMSISGGTLGASGSKTGGSSTIKGKSQCISHMRFTHHIVATILKKQRTIIDDDLLDNAELTKTAKDEEMAAYNKLQCNYSLYLFSKENPFRLLLWKASSSTWFEGIVLGLIIIGSVKLSVDTYFLAESTAIYDTVSYDIDLFFTISFALEALIKVIAFGFVLEPTTYLRESWNQLDFFIVLASIIDTSVTEINIPMIKVLRLLRTFRPLRFVTHNVNMRIIVTALFKSLGAICNTLVVVVVIWLMFSIVGVNFFAGKFQYCTTDPYNHSYKQDCVVAGGEWRTYDHNFDNSINGLIFLFELTTQENWPSLAYQGVDCTDVDQGPEKNSQWYYAYFFVFFLFISSMFLLNLFVGVMFLKFTKVQKHETASFGDIMMKEVQLNWIEVQKMIIRAEPNYNARTVPPQYNWRKPFHQIVTSTVFEIFVAIVIMLNMVQMGMLYEDASDQYLLALEIINYIFTGVFTVELILKLIAFSLNFWYEAWNVFDFFIVLCSFVDILFTNLGTASLKMLRVGPQLIRVLRVLRVSRLLRLVKKYKRLQDIMEIIQLCLPSMMNVFSLLALVLFIYAVLGCYLFYDVKNGNALNDLYNFSNFGSAMILCLKMATGEDWNVFMFDCARTSTSCTAGLGCGNAVSYIYFMSFKLVITFIMLNLFILIVLQLFDKFFINTENIISKFKEDFEIFQEHWQAQAPTHGGFMLNQNKLIRFFGSLPQPLGTEGTSLNETTRTIIDLNIHSNEEKDVFFNELLFCVMRNVYIPAAERNDFMRNKERDTQRKIQSLAEAASRRGHYKTARKTFIKTANPFVSLMLLRMTAKLWKKYNTIHKKHVEEHELIGELNYESSREEEMPTPKAKKKEEASSIHRRSRDLASPRFGGDPRTSFHGSGKRQSSRNLSSLTPIQ